MKKLLPRHILLCTIITFVVSFSFVHAQGNTASVDYCADSTICGSAPEAFTALLDFVTEMMNAIQTIGTQWDYVGEYVNPNRFIGDTFTPPAKTVVGTLAKNIEQKLKFGLATTAIFSSPINLAGVKDAVWWIILLSKNKVFLRDNKIVEELESQVNDKRYELGLWWWWYEKIIPQNVAIMNDIIQKYVKKWLFSNWEITDGVLYNNVTSLLLRILSAAKSVLYFNSVNQFTEFSRGWENNGIKITFDTQAIQSIQDDYTCADVCDTNKTTFKTIRKNLTASLSGSSYNNKKVFNDALTRLGQLFSKSKQKDDPSYQERKDELLRSMYGTTKDARGVFAGSIKQSLSGILEDVSTLWSDVSRFRNPPKNAQDIKTDIVTNQANQNIMATTTPAQWEATFKEYLKSYVQDVFDQQSTDIELASFSEVKDVTPTFKSLWDQIFNIKTKVIGSKDTDGSLIQGLWQACEAQCNLWWKWCR